jgi:hypothetical protein
MSERKILHIYGQGAHHDDVVVGGNRAGLEALRSAIDAAIAWGVAVRECEVNDGEGFPIYVVHLKEIDAEKMPVPYTSECAAQRWVGEPWDTIRCYDRAALAGNPEFDTHWGRNPTVEEEQK